MTDNTSAAQLPEVPSAPSPMLRTLDTLVGTWSIKGSDITGQVRFAWMEGGYFLAQYVDMTHGGRPIKGIEIIGHDLASNTLKSHYFGNDGGIYEYVWVVEGDELTIWGGEIGSPAYYKGKFNADHSVNAGGWVYPGGGYDSTMTRSTYT